MERGDREGQRGCNKMGDRVSRNSSSQEERRQSSSDTSSEARPSAQEARAIEARQVMDVLTRRWIRP